MALKLSDLVKKSIEKGYGAKNNNIEKPWTQGNISAVDANQNSGVKNNIQLEHISLNHLATQFTTDIENNNFRRANHSFSDNASSNRNENVISNEIGNRNENITSNENDNNKSMQLDLSDNEIICKRKDKIYLNLQKLSGIQLLIFNKILSVKFKSNKEYYSQINTTDLAKDLGLSVTVLRVSLVRIIDKNLLIREPGFVGRNGSTNFKIPSLILKYKDELDQTKKFSSETSVTNNSNLNIDLHINKETAFELNTITSENKWWNDLNLTPLEEYGFKHAQFKQLDGMNKPEIIQESINHFGWGLQYNPKNEKYKENPSRILLSILKKGSAWIEDGYRDPQELAMEQLIENRKNSIERKKKLEEEMYSIALDEWIESLSKEEKIALAPPKNAMDITPQKSKLSVYFKETVWPTIKEHSLT